MIAALFVQRGGAYWGVPGVDPWDEERDARLYAGPHPVVAHPPCARWCRLAGLVEKTIGIKRGADEGCFASALASVRKWGGVLEHPAHTAAWAVFGLPIPARHWARTLCGGWVVEVSQNLYGHRAEKLTWLYGFGINPPLLKRGTIRATHCVSTSRRKRGTIPELPKRERSATPPAFRDLLIAIARSAKPPSE